jgi:hypothetical protein
MNDAQSKTGSDGIGIGIGAERDMGFSLPNPICNPYS